MTDLSRLAAEIAKMVEAAEAQVRHAKFSARLRDLPKDDVLAAGTVVAHHRGMPGFEAEPTEEQAEAAVRVSRRLRD